MTPIFFVTAGVMLIVALLLVLWPLQRGAAKSMSRVREAAGKLRALNGTRGAGGVGEAQSAALQGAIDELLAATVDLERKGARPGIYTGVAVLICVPLVATAMYRWWGTPHSEHFDGAHAHAAVGSGAAPPIDHGDDMQAAIAKLAGKLKQHPDDAEGWALLGRTYKAMQQYAQARDAFRHAVDAAPGDTALAAEYAAAGTPNPEPAMTDDTSPQSCPVPGAAGSTECGDAPQGTARITVKVALNPKFKDQVGPKDTVFVFAKAAQGPAMPLAIMRLTASQLPASVTLTDGMGMVPSLTLSQFPQIVLGARISKSGNAMPQSGDLQTLSAAMTSAQTEPVQLTIDRRVD
jgi:cytochrome c-type biogenesis protein CcmH/NrfG